MGFLTITMAFLSNGYFFAETILKGSIFLVPTALTGIVGCVRALMFLAQCTTFLESHLLGDLVVIGISTLGLAFLALSSGFLQAFFAILSLMLEFATHFSTFSRMPNSFLMLWGSESCVRSY